MLKRYLELPRSVHVLCLGTLINRAGSFLVVFLTLYLKDELGLGVAFATQAVGAYGLGAVVASLLGGHLADRIGRRTVMVISLLGGAGILMIFGSLRSQPAVMAAVMMFAMVMDMYRPAASAMIADLVEPEHRPHAFGLMYVSINLGFSVAPVVGGMVAHYSFRWLFWADASTTAIYAGIIFFAIGETLPSRRSPAADHTNSGDAPAPDETGGSGVWAEEPDAPAIPLGSAIMRIVSDRTFMIFCLAALVLTGVYIQAFSTFPLHLDALGIGPTSYGRIIALNGIIIVCLQLPITALVSRFNRASVLVASAVVIAVGFGLIGMASTVWGFALTVVVWTTGEMMEAPVRLTIAADLAPTELRARYMGVMTMSFSGALAIGAPIGGMVLGTYGGSWLWGGCLGVGLLAAGMFLGIHKQLTPVR